MSGRGDSAATKARNPKREAKRAMAREAAARQAAARLRKRLAVGAVVSLVVIGLVAGGIYLLTRPKPPHKADPLATKPVVTAGTGEVTKLTVTTLVAGSGSPVSSGQTLSVNYVGVSYKTGVEFDSSWKRSEPFSFTVGQGSVIKGWDQGLIGVKVGSRVQLDIPSDLAYGDSGNPAGPLRFVVDVLSAS
jgi:peptidylprolyl isomerase